MQERNGQPQAQPTPEDRASEVTFYWLATIVTNQGKQLTCDATLNATPGVHTRMSTVRSVMDFLRERHGEFVLLYLHLEPNEIRALPHPSVTA